MKKEDLIKLAEIAGYEIETLKIYNVNHPTRKEQRLISTENSTGFFNWLTRT